MNQKEKGLWIATKREALKLSQAALARKIGIDRSYISHIENGDKKVSSDTLMRIMAALDLPVEELVGVEMTQQDQILVNAAFTFYKKLGEYLTPVQVDDVMKLFEQMQEAEAVAVSYLRQEPMPAGPDGWLSLGKNDRLLVQRIINRLLKGEAVSE
jgi:transcriptional regulator with XRE-family HTH domain